MKIRRTNGYSVEIAKQVLDGGKPIRFVGPAFVAKYVWKDGKPTSTVKGYATWFIQEGLPPFTVRFPEKVTLPNKYLQIVDFDNLQACEVRDNVYFKADSLKEVK